MARILRLSPLQRNTLACIALFVITNVVVISQYWGPRRIALSLSLSDTNTNDADADNMLFESESEAEAESDIALNPPRILLVSALFALPTAGSSSALNATSHISHYLEHLPRFLGPITTDVYFYTSSDLAPAVRAARGSASGDLDMDMEFGLTVDTSFASPFDIPPLKGRELVYSRMRRAARDSDDESTNANMHTSLFALRNAKPFFLEHAITTLGAEEDFYDYVFWVDAAGFREEHLYTSWPDPARVEKVWREGSRIMGKAKEDLIFFPVHGLPPKSVMDWTEDMGPIDANFSEGSFFGGPPHAVTWLSRKFYAYHDYFIQLGFSSSLSHSRTNRMGIVNALLVMYPSQFITVWVGDPQARARVRNQSAVRGLLPGIFNVNWNGIKGGGGERSYLGECGDETYYYRWWFSGRDTRDAMRTWWMGHDSNHGQGAVSWKQPARSQAVWWKPRPPTTPCRLAGVLGVEGALRRTFGDAWEVPVGTVSKPSRTW